MPDSDELPRGGAFARSIWVALGTFFLVIGVVGIAIPVLPTTPFLLLAAACYLRGSKRMYSWLLTNRVFGKYLDDYRAKRGMSVKSKAFTLSLLWVLILTSAFLLVADPMFQIIMVCIAVGISAHILTIRTKRAEVGKSATNGD